MNLDSVKAPDFHKAFRFHQKSSLDIYIFPLHAYIHTYINIYSLKIYCMYLFIFIYVFQYNIFISFSMVYLHAFHKTHLFTNMFAINPRKMVLMMLFPLFAIRSAFTLYTFTYLIYIHMIWNNYGIDFDYYISYNCYFQWNNLLSIKCNTLSITR